MKQQEKIIVEAPAKLPAIEEERIRLKKRQKDGSVYKTVNKENKTPFRVMEVENTMDYLPNSRMSEKQIKSAIRKGVHVIMKKPESRY